MSALQISCGGGPSNVANATLNRKGTMEISPFTSMPHSGPVSPTKPCQDDKRQFNLSRKMRKDEQENENVYMYVCK
jgi:hypothetical protein